MNEIILNAEQRRILDQVMCGHNVFISGKAGTGKTFIVKHIVKLMEKTKAIVVTCTTGMACTLYENARTLHSFTGIRNGRRTFDALVSSVMNNTECLARWRSTEILIIDEISQCSMKTWETIHRLAQKTRGNNQVFGGMQVIGVGDFFQLPPVKNDIDEANYCFESEVWKEVFPHTVILQNVYRQDETEREFLNVLGDLASGECSLQTLHFINTQLARKTLDAKDFGLTFVPNIFCNNFDANYYNMEELQKLPGEMKRYHATDTCCELLLKKVTVAEKSISLKEGAEVMLLYNISSKLTNGTRGRIVSLCEDAPIVNFYEVGIHYKVSKVTWFAYKPGSVDTIIGQRTQYPLKLAWGITVHKSQGQTLKACCVHSGNEFVPGQLYVACSRVSSVKGLSIDNFNERKLIVASRKVERFYSQNHDQVCEPSLQCCRKKELYFDCFSGMSALNEPLDGDLDESDIQEIDEICRSYFSQEEDEEVNMLDLEEVLNDILSQASVDASLSDSICPHSMLEQLLKNDSQMVGCIVEKYNALIDFLQTDEMLPKVKSFTRIQCTRLWQALHDKAKKKRDGPVKFDFKGLRTSEMTLLSSPEIVHEFASLLDNVNLDIEHYCLLTEFVKAIRGYIIGHLYNSQFSNIETENQGKSVWDMSNEGQGKVRYVGGWTIIKLIYSFKKYITTNISSCNPSVRQEMRRRYLWINLLDSILVHSTVVHQSSSYKATLTVTDVKQYRNNSLVYVDDSTFEFFMELEQKRIGTLCHHNLNIMKGDVLAVAITAVKCNEALREKWNHLFSNSDEDGKQSATEILFHKVIDRYFQMGAGQYIRDFRRDYNVIKTEAHRKRIQEKKIIKDRQREKLTLKEIKDDSSVNRQNSHNKLLVMVTTRDDIFVNTYSKQEIKVIFQAYGQKYVDRWLKPRLNETLVRHIKEATRFTNPNAFDC